MEGPISSLDSNLRLGVTLLFFLWNIFVASRLETSYPESLVELYALPITRMLLLGIVILSSLWCPKVSIMAAFAFVCLGADIIFLTRTP